MTIINQIEKTKKILENLLSESKDKQYSLKCKLFIWRIDVLLKQEDNFEDLKILLALIAINFKLDVPNLELKPINPILNKVSLKQELDFVLEYFRNFLNEELLHRSNEITKADNPSDDEIALLKIRHGIVKQLLELVQEALPISFNKNYLSIFGKIDDAIGEERFPNEVLEKLVAIKRYYKCMQSSKNSLVKRTLMFPELTFSKNEQSPVITSSTSNKSVPKVKQISTKSARNLPFEELTDVGDEDLAMQLALLSSLPNNK